MATAKKPTKQQIAQAKARAGGNNPVKVTNAELKKLGQAAVIAASFTPVGRGAKAVATAIKAAKTAKAAKATRTLAEPSKASVKVLPRKTAPKSGLENRGARPSASQRSDRAMDYEFGKVERAIDAQADVFYGGMRGPKEGMMRAGSKRNIRKSAAVSREARKTVKIDSQRNLRKKK
jgi:hypothetical protein